MSSHDTGQCEASLLPGKVLFNLRENLRINGTTASRRPFRTVGKASRFSKLMKAESCLDDFSFLTKVLGVVSNSSTP